MKENGLILSGVRQATQDDHNYMRAYAADISQTASSDDNLADISNVWQAALKQVSSKVEPIKKS